MTNKWLILIFSVPLLISFLVGGETGVDLTKYHNPQEINNFLNGVVKSNKGITRLHKIADTPGGNKVYILEIGDQIRVKKKTAPAILVTANFDGINSLSSEASLFLISELIKSKEKRNNFTWYILPVGNPDAAWRCFKKPFYKDSGNEKPINDDKDEMTDEDGVEDLNGDGVITMMRVKDPEGEFLSIPGNKKLMKKADWVKGEKGSYKLYSEGIDNDGDGKYNEDGPGGVDISVNFPHLFKPFTKKGGDWPGSEAEVFGLFKFVFSHDDIAMTMNYGDTNFCMIPPQGGRKSQVDMAKIKVPERIGKFMGIDTDRTYSMKEIMEIVKKVVPAGFEVTESMVASFMGLGAVVNPLKGDLKFYEKISEEYKEYLKKIKLDAKRLDPKKARDGSFELWSYYHLGLPTFTMDFWTLPKVEKKKKDENAITADKLEKMTKEEFLALGKEKIEKFLKSVNAPKNIKAEFLINGVKSGAMTPKKMAGFMKNMKKPEDNSAGTPEETAIIDFSEKKLGGKGFIDWKPFDHPTLGEVEIGGISPLSNKNPPPSMIGDLVGKQVPFIFELVKKLPIIKISDVKVTDMGAGVYKIKVWIENRGFLPYPTEMGKKNARISNIIVTLNGKGIKLLNGKKRSIIKSIGGNGNKSVEWLILSSKPASVLIKSETRIASNDSKSINVGGKK